MTKTQITTFRPVYPSPVALITCAAADGQANVITLAEVFNISIAKRVGWATCCPRKVPERSPPAADLLLPSP